MHTETNETWFVIFERIIGQNDTRIDMVVGNTSSSVFALMSPLGRRFNIDDEKKNLVFEDVGRENMSSAHDEIFMRTMLTALLDDDEGVIPCLPLTISRRSHKDNSDVILKQIYETTFPKYITKIVTTTPLDDESRAEEVDAVLEFIETSKQGSTLEEEEDQTVEEDSSHACGICWTRKKMYALSCGHLYCCQCSRTALAQGSCPTCRQRVSRQRQRVYM
jgi:hypothetical protein